MALQHLDIVSGGALSRQIARPHNAVFHGIFTESNLTKIQKIKQFVQCIAYDAGKRVARMQRMTEQSLHQEMNKAYYMRLQVLFADIDDDRSYWKKHLGFDFTFANMMTHTFGHGTAQPTYFFDYQGNEDLDEGQVEQLKLGWTNSFLWRRYGELKTEMQSQMLTVLMKQRIKALDGGDSYTTGSGTSFAEMFYAFLGALFQIDANAKHEDRVRKRQRAAAVPAAAASGESGAVVVNRSEDADENGDGGASQPPVAAQSAGRGNVRDAPDRWGDAHVAWRHSSLFVFVLNGPITFFHPDPGSRSVCEFLKKAPRSGPPVDGAAARNVEHRDSRRQQRRHEGRDAAISQADDQNRNFIEEIAMARRSQDRAAQESNQLARLQLQVQLAAMQQKQQTDLGHIQNLRAAIDMLNNLPDGMQLSETQKKQKADMEQRYTDAVFVLGQHRDDPFASLSAAIAHATQPSSDFAGLNTTVPRFPSSAGGGGNRASTAGVSNYLGSYGNAALGAIEDDDSD
jgi:hypothetical protein